MSIQSEQYVWRKDISTSHQNEFVVGIDFGTTNSCVAIWNPYKKRAKVIKNISSKRLTRSNIKFEQDFENPTIGVTEINELCSTQVISRIKLFLGNSNDHIACRNLKNEECEIATIDLCSFILKYMKSYTEAYIKKNINQLQSVNNNPVYNKSSSSAILLHQRQLPLKAAVIGMFIQFPFQIM